MVSEPGVWSYVSGGGARNVTDAEGVNCSATHITNEEKEFVRLRYVQYVRNIHNPVQKINIFRYVNHALADADSDPPFSLILVKNLSTFWKGIVLEVDLTDITAFAVDNEDEEEDTDEE